MFAISSLLNLCLNTLLRLIGSLRHAAYCRSSDFGFITIRRRLAIRIAQEKFILVSQLTILWRDQPFLLQISDFRDTLYCICWLDTSSVPSLAHLGYHASHFKGRTSDTKSFFGRVVNNTLRWWIFIFPLNCILLNIRMVLFTMLAPFCCVYIRIVVTRKADSIFVFSVPAVRHFLIHYFIIITFYTQMEKRLVAFFWLRLPALFSFYLIIKPASYHWSISGACNPNNSLQSLVSSIKH